MAALLQILPLLQKLQSLFAKNEGLLEGWHCIYVQHVLRSNIDCAQFLVNMGASKRSLQIFGKAYSTSDLALDEYRSHGYNVLNTGIGYSYSEPFDSEISRRIADFARVLIAHGKRKLLVVDEGGLAIQALGGLNLDGLEQLAVTELTARGAQHYPLVSTRCPVVDVARSWVKKTVEPPIIATSMINNLELELKNNLGIRLERLRFGVIGAGAIGQAIIRLITERGGLVSWFDSQKGRSSRETLAEVVESSDIILSSTGIGNDLIASLVSDRSEMVLVNCGSSDVEFGLWNVRQSLANYGFSFDVEVPGEPWRGAIRIRNLHRVRHILRGGFPINFDGTPDPIPADQIQITRAILMAGALQAVLASEPGVYELDRYIQAELFRAYNQLLTNSRS